MTVLPMFVEPPVYKPLELVQVDLSARGFFVADVSGGRWFWCRCVVQRAGMSSRSRRRRENGWIFSQEIVSQWTTISRRDLQIEVCRFSMKLVFAQVAKRGMHTKAAADVLVWDSPSEHLSLTCFATLCDGELGQ